VVQHGDRQRGVEARVAIRERQAVCHQRLHPHLSRRDSDELARKVAANGGEAALGAGRRELAVPAPQVGDERAVRQAAHKLDDAWPGLVPSAVPLPRNRVVDAPDMLLLESGL